MADVAEACGLAISTVSRALKNPDRVSESTRDLVLRTARELGYGQSPRPADVRDPGNSIALMLPNLANPYVLDLIRGSQGQAQAAGYHYQLVNFMESVQLEADFLRALSSAAGGIVLSSPRSANAVLQEAAGKVPLVAINRAVPGVPCVVVDSSTGLANAVEHLAGLRHTRIAYVHGPPTSWSDQYRFRAVRAAVNRHGMGCAELGPFYPSLQTGAAAADAVLLSGATAAIFFNDVLALGALTRFADRDVAVPGDISVIGCDDVFGTTFSSPPLTTVTAPGEIIGRAATDVLITNMTGTTPVQKVERFTAHLTLRQTTGPARS